MFPIGLMPGSIYASLQAYLYTGLQVCRVEGDDLFSLGMQESNTYYALNSASTTDEQSENVIDRIVSGLFSVVVCMGA